MAAVISTALPHCCWGRHGRASLLARKRSSTRCLGGSWLRECRSAVVHSSHLAGSPFGFEGCDESEVEIVQGGTLPEAMRSPGVGLLASLVTLAANFHSVFGLEVLLEVSQAGVVSEKSGDYNRDASFTSVASPNNLSYSEVFSIATSHNETSTLDAVAENVTPPDECTEEVATSLAPKAEPVQEVTNESVVQEAWQKKKQEVLKNPIRSRMAAYGAIRTMLSSLNDPYTRFLSPDQFSELSKYDVTGIGLNIGESATPNGESYLKVLGIILGSPAQLVEVRQGDELLEVPVVALVVRQLLRRLRSFKVQRAQRFLLRFDMAGVAPYKFLQWSVSRMCDHQCVTAWSVFRIRNKCLVIYMKEFNARAKRDILTAMKRMQVAGAASFVLDLKDNPGGLVQAGIEVAKLFLDEGETVIETVGRDASNIRSVLASYSPVTKPPLTILVNDHSASASEIVAAALHDNRRACL